MKSAPEGIEIYPIFVSDQSRQYMRTLISILWISFFPLAAAAQDDDLSYRLKKAIKDKKAEIGIAVILDAQDTVTVNNDDRYPLMSVFKFHQALAVADYLDRNGLTPDTEIFIPEEVARPRHVQSPSEGISRRRNLAFSQPSVGVQPAAERQQRLRHPLRAHGRSGSDRPLRPVARTAQFRNRSNGTADARRSANVLRKLEYAARSGRSAGAARNRTS